MRFKPEAWQQLAGGRVADPRFCDVFAAAPWKGASNDFPPMSLASLPGCGIFSRRSPGVRYATPG